MLSTLRGVTHRFRRACLFGRAVRVAPPVASRRWYLVPSDQYDNNQIPNRFRMSYALVHYWEIVPLFLSTCVSMTILIIAIFWATKNKVDVVFSREGGSLSRTMDLRHPTVHKMMTVTQRYEPWPELQDVLDKMREAEKKVYMRAANCTTPD